MIKLINSSSAWFVAEVH